MAAGEEEEIIGAFSDALRKVGKTLLLSSFAQERLTALLWYGVQKGLLGLERERISGLVVRLDKGFSLFLLLLRMLHLQNSLLRDFLPL